MPYNPESLNHRRALAVALISALERAGFTPDPDAKGERVYMRPVDSRPGVLLKVYTSIPLDGNAVRPKDGDAIRVVALYVGSDRPRPVAREARVFRVGESPQAIAERTIERCRDAWRRVTSRPRCRHCGTVTFTAKSGKDTCAAICWTKRRASA